MSTSHPKKQCKAKLKDPDDKGYYFCLRFRFHFGKHKDYLKRRWK